MKSVDEYLQEGVLPEALLNFVATMGWHPSENGDNSGSRKSISIIDDSKTKCAETNSEVLSMSDLVKQFSLDRVQKAGAVVDERKLLHLSQQHLQRQQPQRLLQRLREHPRTRTVLQPFPDDYVLRVLSISSDRLHTLTEFCSTPLFRRPKWTCEGSLNKFKAELLQTELMTLLPESFKDTKKLDEWLRGIAAEQNVPLHWILVPLRVLLTGLKHGPGVPSLLFALGREATLKRYQVLLLL